MKKSLKVLVSTVLVLVLMMTVAFAVPGRESAPGQLKKDNLETEFNDMTGHWALAAVQNLTAMGKIKGVGNGKFAPASAAKQIEVLVMTLRYLDLEEDLDLDAILPPAYKGMKPKEWMIPYLELAMEHDILTDDEAEDFNPNKSASRSWTAVIIVRALDMVDEAEEMQDDPLPYNDAAAVPLDRIGYVNLITKLELMIGHNNNFQPNKPLSRAEMAVLFGRLFGTENSDELHKVTFDENGGSLITDRIVYHNTKINNAPVSTKTGYTLEGWYTNSGLTNKVAFPYTVTDDVTFYAKWTINQYTITFDSVGGTAVAAITQNYGTAVTAPSIPTKVNSTFYGWSPALPTTMPAMNMTLTAQWELKEYTVRFEENGGSAVENITQDYGTMINTAPTSTKTGYTLEGWYSDIGLTHKVIFPYTITADARLYAKWNINEYTVDFIENGGSPVVNIIEDYNTIIAAAPFTTRTGHTFEGWYTEETLINKVNFPYTIKSNVNLYANWTIDQYTITFDSSGGTPVAAITQNYDTTITEPDEPTRTGYEFLGWNPELPEKMPANNMTLTAQWELE